MSEVRRLRELAQRQHNAMVEHLPMCAEQFGVRMQLLTLRLTSRRVLARIDEDARNGVVTGHGPEVEDLRELLS